MTALSFFVHGTPAPQGSKRHVGRGIMVESSKKVAPWRQDVTAAALEAITAFGVVDEPFLGPVEVHVTFYFTRPKSHFRTGKFAHLLKESAPGYVVTKPDIDKLLRSTFDALTTAGVWRDDNQAVDVTTAKLYDSRPGAFIKLTGLAVGD